MNVCRSARVFLLAGLLILPLFLTGCSLFDLGGADINSNDPSQKIPAMRQAGNNHDQSAVPALVDALGSDDAAVRFYAISALEQITGQQLGYVYYAPKLERNAAIDRWKAWLAKNSATRPESS